MFILSTIIGSLVLLNSLLFYLVWQLDKRDKRREYELKGTQRYIAELTILHNVICEEVKSHMDSLESLGANFNLLRDAHNKAVERIQYIYTNWQTEWNGGYEWKNGTRPDGSKVQDETEENSEDDLDDY